MFEKSYILNLIISEFNALYFNDSICIKIDRLKYKCNLIIFINILLSNYKFFLIFFLFH